MNKQEKILLAISLYGDELDKDGLAVILEEKVSVEEVEKLIEEITYLKVRRGYNEKAYLDLNEMFRLRIQDNYKEEIPGFIDTWIKGLLRNEFEELYDGRKYKIILNLLELIDVYEEKKEQLKSKEIIDKMFKALMKESFLGDGERIKGIKYCFELITLIEDMDLVNKDEYLSEVYVKLSSNYTAINKYEKGYKYAALASEHSKKLQPLERGIINIKVGIAIKSNPSFEIMEKFTLEGLNILTDIYNQTKDVDMINIKENYYDISRATNILGERYTSNHKHKEALKMYQYTKEIYDYINEKYNYMKGMVYWRNIISLANCYEYFGIYEKSLEIVNLLREKGIGSIEDIEVDKLNCAINNKDKFNERIEGLLGEEVDLDKNIISAFIINKMNKFEKPLYLAEDTNIKINSFEDLKMFFESINIKFDAKSHIEELNDIDEEGEMDDITYNADLRILGLLVDGAIIENSYKVFNINEGYDLKRDNDYKIQDATYYMNIEGLKRDYVDSKLIVAITELGNDIFEMDNEYEVNIYIK